MKSSTPESEFDEWYTQSHPNGTSWEDDEEIPDREIMDDDKE